MSRVARLSEVKTKKAQLQDRDSDIVIADTSISELLVTRHLGHLRRVYPCACEALESIRDHRLTLM